MKKERNSYANVLRVSEKSRVSTSTGPQGIHRRKYNFVSIIINDGNEVVLSTRSAKRNSTNYFVNVSISLIAPKRRDKTGPFTKLCRTNRPTFTTFAPFLRFTALRAKLPVYVRNGCCGVLLNFFFFYVRYSRWHTVNQLVQR